MKPAIAGPAYPCLWCRQPIVFVQGQSWLHPEGGLYMRRCPNCAWRGAPALEPDLCPSCHGAKLVDDHLATPDRSNPADPSAPLPIRTQPRPRMPPAATAARPPDGGVGWVQDPEHWAVGGVAARPEPADVVPIRPGVVVQLPARVEFVAEIRTWGQVRVVAVRRGGCPHLVHVYDADGDLLPSLAVDTVCMLQDQADTALAIEERELAAVEEARHVGQL